MTRIKRNRTNYLFLDLCLQIDDFLQTALYRMEMGQLPPESLERAPEGELYTKRQLPCGIVLRASAIPTERTISRLQICFDPLRFSLWRESIGPTSLVFLNPYGIELSTDPQTGEWGLFLDGKPLPLDLESQETYQVTQVEIRPDDSDDRAVYWTE